MPFLNVLFIMFMSNLDFCLDFIVLELWGALLVYSLWVVKEAHTAIYTVLLHSVWSVPEALLTCTVVFIWFQKYFQLFSWFFKWQLFIVKCSPQSLSICDISVTCIYINKICYIYYICIYMGVCIYVCIMYL